MYLYYNPNPAGKRTGDCAYRGIAAFFGLNWMTAVFQLVTHAANQGSVNFTHVTNITGYMKSKGYERHKPDRPMTVGEFAVSLAKEGYTYMVLVKKPRHITVIGPDRMIHDIGDTSEFEVKYYWENPSDTIKQ